MKYAAASAISSVRRPSKVRYETLRRLSAGCEVLKTPMRNVGSGPETLVVVLVDAVELCELVLVDVVVAWELVPEDWALVAGDGELVDDA